MTINPTQNNKPIARETLLSLTDSRKSDDADFAPVFLVGAPRSGTTMLAVLLDRHSRISIPPETEFFYEFVPQLCQNGLPSDPSEMVDSALKYPRIADLKLDRDAVLETFRGYDSTLPNLLRAILETYTSTHGKVRPGEKSPKHIEHVPTIINSYPLVKMICIVRDGRDTIQSLLKVPWALPKSTRRFGLFCMEWSDYARLSIEYAHTYPPDQFTLVKYENIILNPQFELERLLEFIGEEFEPSQLDPNINTSVVPVWENEWKGKASAILDTSRVEAWRKMDDQYQIWAMNRMMEPMLRRMGYSDVNLKDCPWFLRVKLAIFKIPYLRPMRPISLLGLRMLRWIKGIGSKDKQP